MKDSNFFAINFLIYISKTRQTILAEEKLTSLQIHRRMYRIRIPVIFHFLLIEFSQHPEWRVRKGPCVGIEADGRQEEIRAVEGKSRRIARGWWRRSPRFSSNFPNLIKTCPL